MSFCSKLNILLYIYFPFVLSFTLKFLGWNFKVPLTRLICSKSPVYFWRRKPLLRAKLSTMDILSILIIFANSCNVFFTFVYSIINLIYLRQLVKLYNGATHFKNINNCLNTNIYSYLDLTSGGQSSNPYLNVVHFINITAD